MKNRKAIVVFVLSLLFLSVLSISANAAEMYVFETKWGSKGAAVGQFDSPGDIAVDRAGNVYVADTDNHRIQKIDPAGRFSVLGSGLVDEPGGVAVDSSGLLYVADTRNNRILKLDVSGNLLGQWGSEGTENGQFKRPKDVAVDSSGNVYVVEWSNSRVQKFDQNGRFLTKWGKVNRISGAPESGSDDGEFFTPRNIAIDRSGNIYVADSGNSRIQKFDSNGRFLTKWPVGEYMYPIYVAVDGAGDVYVSDSGNNCIRKFDPRGNLKIAWGTDGSDDDRLRYPTGLAVDSAKNVYVANAASDATCIKKFKVTEAGGEVVIPTTTTISRIAAVMSTATLTLPPQYIISVHEGGNSEGILQIVHDANSEGLMSKLSAVVPAPGAALGAPIEDARVRVGRETFTTDPNGRTSALILKERDVIYITKSGYKTLRITIPLKKYADRFSGIVVQLKRQLEIRPGTPVVR